MPKVYKRLLPVEMGGESADRVRRLRYTPGMEQAQENAHLQTHKPVSRDVTFFKMAPNRTRGDTYSSHLLAEMSHFLKWCPSGHVVTHSHVVAEMSHYSKWRPSGHVVTHSHVVAEMSQFSKWRPSGHVVTSFVCRKETIGKNHWERLERKDECNLVIKNSTFVLKKMAPSNL